MLVTGHIYQSAWTRNTKLNVQGWTQGVLKTVGINNDESSTNALVANAKGIASWASILAAGTLGDTSMTINPNSTGEFVVRSVSRNTMYHLILLLTSFTIQVSSQVYPVQKATILLASGRLRSTRR